MHGMRKTIVGFAALALASIVLVAIATHGGRRDPGGVGHDDPVASSAEAPAEGLDDAGETPRSVSGGEESREPVEEAREDVQPRVDVSIGPLAVHVRAAGSGTPISGATVTCDAGPAATTDSEGVARLDADAGKEHRLRATASGFCPGTLYVEPGPSGAKSEHALTLVSPASVFGIVRGPDGAPTQGARVLIHLSSPGLIRPVSSYVDGLPTGSATMTDADGAFRFEGIGSAAGRWRAMIVVLGKGCARLEGEAFDVHNGDVVGPLQFDLREGARVHGFVSSSGVGAHATIFLPGSDEFVDTEPNGTFVFDHLPTGEIALDAALLDSPGVRTSVSLAVQPGEDRRLDIALDYEMRAFSGFVSTPQGTPVTGVRVWCETSAFYSLVSKRYWARTNQNGHYRIEFPVKVGEAELRCTLRLERWEDDCAVQVDARQTTVDIECADSRRVKLTVVDATDGKPLSNFKPVWHPHGDANVQIVMLDYEMGPNGQVESVLPSGPGDLRIHPSGYVPRILPLSSQPEGLLDLGEVRVDPKP